VDRVIVPTGSIVYIPEGIITIEGACRGGPTQRQEVCGAQLIVCGRAEVDFRNLSLTASPGPAALQIRGDAVVTMTRCMIVEAKLHGMHVMEKGKVMHMEDCKVTGCGVGSKGDGLFIENDARVTATKCVFERNHNRGVAVLDCNEDAEVVLNECRLIFNKTGLRVGFDKDPTRNEDRSWDLHAAVDVVKAKGKVTLKDTKIRNNKTRGIVLTWGADVHWEVHDPASAILEDNGQKNVERYPLHYIVPAKLIGYNDDDDEEPENWLLHQSGINPLRLVELVRQFQQEGRL